MSLTDPASPWPPALPGLGNRHVEAFTPCLLCRTGTWGRYGGLPLCLRCARSWVESRGTAEGARAMLWGLLGVWSSMNEAEWTDAEVAALHDQVLSFWPEWGDQAEAWWLAWKRAHPNAKLV